MKSNAGITMTSLIIYIIAMTIVVGIVATVTSFFYTNVGNMDSNSQNVSEITKFNMYFIEQVEKENNAIMVIAENKKAISFTTGDTFTFQDNAIYKNSVRICEKVKNFQVEMAKENGKTVITVLMTVGENMEYTKTTQYVMKQENVNITN